MNTPALNDWFLSPKKFIFNDEPAVDDDGLGWDFRPYQITPENHKGKLGSLEVWGRVT